MTNNKEQICLILAILNLLFSIVNLAIWINTHKFINIFSFLFCGLIAIEITYQVIKHGQK